MAQAAEIILECRTKGIDEQERLPPRAKLSTRIKKTTPRRVKLSWSDYGPWRPESFSTTRHTSDSDGYRACLSAQDSNSKTKWSAPAFTSGLSSRAVQPPVAIVFNQIPFVTMTFAILDESGAWRVTKWSKGSWQMQSPPIKRQQSQLNPELRGHEGARTSW